MAIESMTGFARAAGTAGIHGWAWEIRSVNGRGLDLRVRVPPGLEALAEAARTLAPGGRLWMEHFDSIDGINAFHRRAGCAVAEHMLASEQEIRALVTQAGLEIVVSRDQEDGFHLCARKP